MPEESLLVLLDEARGKTLRLLNSVGKDGANWARPGLQNTILSHAGHAELVLTSREYGDQTSFTRRTLTSPDRCSRPALWRLVAAAQACGTPRNRLTMSRFARHTLFASVIALHAIVSLCGQCLHELPGSSHQLGPASKTDGRGDPAQSPRDSADNCLICHFVAQSQLAALDDCEISALLVAELSVPSFPTDCSFHTHVPSSPRAPPAMLGG